MRSLLAVVRSIKLLVGHNGLLPIYPEEAEMKFSTPKTVYSFFVVVLLSGVGCAIAQDGGVVAADPAALISQTAETLAASNGASADIRVEIRVVQNEEENSNVNIFNYSKADGGKFALLTKDENGQELPEGITVRSNGAVTLTAIGEMKKHQLEESNKGIASFVQSPLSGGIANGLGSLVFAMLDVETAGELQSQLTGSEIIGEEVVDGESLTHARFQVGGQLTFDAWFSTGENPVVKRVVPDLSPMTEAARQQFEKFEYSVTFDFSNWQLNNQYEATAFNFEEPAGSTLVLTFMESEEREASPLLGQKAPSFELNDLAGGSVNLADHLGKDVIVLDFWATWCPPCVRALPVINQVTSEFADKGVVFYALDQQEDVETVNAFLADRGLNPPVLLDDAGAASDAYGVTGLPTSVIIGKDGTIQVFHVGFAPNLGEILTEELEVLVEGKDLAAELIAETQAMKLQEQAMLKALSDKLKASNEAN